ncbi:hypothetical protein [Actinoplanes solisilvae]|uniref:hypothetical protein n=1 Tax=Actinoplanes solisilvae TaxID=2486853 RepID=UPI000FDB739E|nr:hypothetical protein [Actinoplanes solisilvae]
MDSADSSLKAYDEGRSDGEAGRRCPERADDPDYRVGLVDGQLAAFEAALIAAIRKAMDGKS